MAEMWQDAQAPSTDPTVAVANVIEAEDAHWLTAAGQRQAAKLSASDASKAG